MGTGAQRPWAVAERVVTPLELFFDLVYVFALGQLSHHLLEHVDLRTLVRLTAAGRDGSAHDQARLSVNGCDG